MSRFTLIALFVLGAVLGLACTSAGPPTQPLMPDTHAQAGNPENHVAWGVFDVIFDLENGTAEIAWNREAEMHLNVTAVATPPNCYDCVTVADFLYNPNSLIFYLQMSFRNPTGHTGYDVRAVLSSPGGDKFMLNPDGMTSVWGSPMQFRAINVDPERTFGPFEVHGRMFEFYFPPGETWQQVSYIIDASTPGYTDEPLVETGYSDPVVNNGFSTTFVRAHVWDHQGDLNPASVIVDLMGLGGSPMTPMYDDGLHNDLGAGDGTYGTSTFTTISNTGVYMTNVYAIDYANHMGWGQVPVSVQQTIPGPNDDPVILGVTWDRTTANGQQNERIKITVDAVDPDGDPLGYIFGCTSGSFTGQSDNFAYWKPASSSTGPQTITVTVVDDKGGQDSREGTLWSTNLPTVTTSSNPEGLIPSGTLTSVVPTATLHMNTDFMGEVLYINIWATWCGWCMVEMPDLTALYHMYENNPDYNQIFLNDAQTEAIVMGFINGDGSNYDCTYWALDPNGSYFNNSLKPFNGGSGGIPQHFLFDRDGHCRFADIGAFTSGTQVLEDAIDQLL